MNERAIELFKQALEYAYTKIGKEHAHTEFFQGLVAGKLAELIVRECVQSIERTIETSCEFDSEKMGCEFAITDLKKHFGVE
jgi:hypothetical protein